MFSKEYEFRYGDCDRNGKIKLCTILDMLQDVSIDHAASAGLGSDFLQSENIAFLLDGWRIKLKEEIKPDETVTASTGIMNIKKCETVRKYEVCCGDSVQVTATALWFSVNIQKRSIIKPDEGFFSGFDCTCEEDNGLEYVNLRPDKQAEGCGEFKVARRDIDSNNHMNNVKSVEVLLDYLPENFRISELQVRYRRELTEGEKAEVYTSRHSDGIYLEIKNGEGKPCVLLKAVGTEN